MEVHIKGFSSIINLGQTDKIDYKVWHHLEIPYYDFNISNIFHIALYFHTSYKTKQCKDLIIEIINPFSKCLIVDMIFKLFNFLQTKQKPQLVVSLHELSILWDYKQKTFLLFIILFFHYHKGNVKNAFEVKEVEYLSTVA